MNKVCLVGRLTKDPILKTANDISIVNFTIAVNRNFKNKEGKYDADFINCVAYKGTGDFINKYFRKGNSIGVDGRIQTRTYDREDETKAFVTEIIVENAEFIESKKEESNTSKEELNVPQNYKTEYQENEETIHLSDEDLPF